MNKKSRKVKITSPLAGTLTVTARILRKTQDVVEHICYIFIVLAGLYPWYQRSNQVLEVFAVGMGAFFFMLSKLSKPSRDTIDLIRSAILFFFLALTIPYALIVAFHGLPPISINDPLPKNLVELIGYHATFFAIPSILVYQWLTAVSAVEENNHMTIIILSVTSISILLSLILRNNLVTILGFTLSEILRYGHKANY